MDIDIETAAKLFAPFYTETGKSVCLEWVKLNWADPKLIFALPKAVPGIAEPHGDKIEKGKAMAIMLRDLATGIIEAARGQELLEKAIAEAKPSLFARDYAALGKVNANSQQYRLSHQRPA